MTSSKEALNGFNNMMTSQSEAEGEENNTTGGHRGRESVELTTSPKGPIPPLLW